MKSTTGYIAATLLTLSVIVANWLTSTFGFIDVGFGQQATAGTLAAGFALASRDAVQDLLGRKLMLIALAIAAAISYIVADPMIAIASLAAFTLSELLDFAIYTPIRNRARLGDRRWFAAVTTSSIAGAIADTAIFIGIAFGAAAIAPALVGQLIGKAWATVLYLLIGKAVALWSSTSRTRVVQQFARP